MKKRSLGAVALSLMMIASIGSAFAASGSSDSDHNFKSSYSSGSCTVGSLTLSAVGTKQSAFTTAVNASRNSCCIVSSTKEMNYNVVISKDYQIECISQGTPLNSSITRHSDINGYKCEHYAARYGTTNTSNCNTTTLADSYKYTAYN